MKTFKVSTHISKMESISPTENHQTFSGYIGTSANQFIKFYLTRNSVGQYIEVGKNSIIDIIENLYAEDPDRLQVYVKTGSKIVMSQVINIDELNEGQKCSCQHSEPNSEPNSDPNSERIIDPVRIYNLIKCLIATAIKKQNCIKMALQKGATPAQAEGACSWYNAENCKW